MLSHVSREGFCAAGFSDSKWDLLCYSFRLSLLYTIFLTNSTGKVEYEVKYHVNFYGAENVDKYKKSKSSEETLENCALSLMKKAAS